MYRDIDNYEGLYAVDEGGNIWSHEKLSPIGIRGGFVKRGGCILKTAKHNRTNHLRVVLTKNGVRKQCFVHRLVALMFIPNPHGLPFINHKDCDPTNNAVSNLEWCTAKQNSIHAYQHGRWTPPNQAGSANSNAQLTESDVVRIRVLHKTIGNCAEISREYGVNPKTINMIINGKRWNTAPFRSN